MNKILIISTILIGFDAVTSDFLTIENRCLSIAENSEIVDEIILEVHTGQECIKATVQKGKISSQFRVAFDAYYKRNETKGLIDMVPEVCATFYRISDCAAPFLDKIRHCYTEPQTEVLVKKTFTDFVDVFCENKYQNVIDYIENDGPNCIAIHPDQRADCQNYSLEACVRGMYEEYVCDSPKPRKLFDELVLTDFITAFVMQAKTLKKLDTPFSDLLQEFIATIYDLL